MGKANQAIEIAATIPQSLPSQTTQPTKVGFANLLVQFQLPR
jgi:hypothetical protein